MKTILLILILFPINCTSKTSTREMHWCAESLLYNSILNKTDVRNENEKRMLLLCLIANPEKRNEYDIIHD